MVESYQLIACRQRLSLTVTTVQKLLKSIRTHRVAIKWRLPLFMDRNESGFQFFYEVLSVQTLLR